MYWGKWGWDTQPSHRYHKKNQKQNEWINKSVNKVLCLRVLKALIIVMIMIIKWKPKATTVLKRVDVGLSQHNKTTEKCLWEIFSETQYLHLLGNSSSSMLLFRISFSFFNFIHCLDEFHKCEEMFWQKWVYPANTKPFLNFIILLWRIIFFPQYTALSFAKTCSKTMWCH